MRRVMFVDLETSGLDPRVNQILEFACMPVIDGQVLYHQQSHFYINHSQITYSFKNLQNFKNRVTDRTAGVIALSAAKAESAIKIAFDAFKDSCHGIILGGKNVGIFDAQFLQKFLTPETFTVLCKHRCVDVAAMYARKMDEAPPSLSQCLVRAKEMGITGPYIDKQF